MNRRSIPFGLMLFPLLCAIAVPAPAQTANHTVPSRQQAADATARKQLAASLAAFQNSPEDTTLRDEIVALAKTLNPPPAIPQLPRANFAQASAQMNAASSADDFEAAARLFEQVAVQAPWFADADFSAASAYARAGDYDGAKRNLALYMAAVRPGVDTRNAEELGRNLDQQRAAQQFQQALQQFRANPSVAARQQVIKLAQAVKPPPEIPEEARGHYVMAEVLVNAAEDFTGHEQRAIDEYKAALLAAPWWGDAYKMLATAQKAAGRYEDAIANLNFYQLTQPVDARNAQDEIYRLKALEERAADDEAMKQTEEQQRKLLEEQQQKERATAAARKYTVEGRWYEIPAPNDYFVGGMARPECDYFINRKGGQWAITNSCSRPTWAIDKIQVETRQISFRLSGHDPGYPFTRVVVTFTLSEDGEALEGQESVYNNGNEPIGDHPVRWVRRE